MSEPSDLGQASMTFDWPARQRSSWLLAGLIFLSLFVHGLAFLLIQSVPPKETMLPRSAPAVGLISRITSDGSYSLDNDILLNWVNAQDPALVARTPELPFSELFNLPYRASFLTSRTLPRGIPPEAASVQFPSPRPALDLITSSTRPPRDLIPTTPSPSGSILFSPTLTARAPQTAPPIISISSSIKAAQFLIGVSDRGEVRFTFPQESSGSPEADAVAENFVRDMRFAPGDTPMIWGMVNVRCRNETVAAKPPDEDRK